MSREVAVIKEHVYNWTLMVWLTLFHYYDVLHCQISMYCTHFTTRSSYASAVLGIIILSVCLFVCHTRTFWRNERTHCLYFDITWKSNHSSFLTPKEVGGPMSPSTWNLHLKWPIPFEKRRLRPISAYNISTVRASEKCSRFPTSYRWSLYVTPNSPKGWLKKRIFCFCEWNSNSIE